LRQWKKKSGETSTRSRSARKGPGSDLWCGGNMENLNSVRLTTGVRQIKTEKKSLPKGKSPLVHEPKKPADGNI